MKKDKINTAFDKARLEALRSEETAFRGAVEEDLVAYFKEKSAEQVVRAMVDWIDLDELLELRQRCIVATRIFG